MPSRPQHEEYFKHVFAYISKHYVRHIIVLLGDNDFCNRGGIPKPLYDQALSDPAGVADSWVDTAVHFAAACGAESVCLSMLHARMSWCETTWR